MSTELLITLLQDLAKSNTINTTRNPDLDAVAKRLQVDEDFRVELGNQDCLWFELALIFKRVIKDGLDPEQVDQLMFIFRIIRNCTADNSTNQDRARNTKLIPLIQEIVSIAAHTHYGNVTYIMMLRAGVQALSNLVTGNDLSKDQAWKSFLVAAPSPSCDQNLLSTLVSIEDETVVLSTVVFCYNCIFESRERSELLFSTTAGKKILAQLLNESHALSGKEERKSFEMIYTFFDHLISRDYFAQLFEVLSPGSGDEEEYRIRYHGEDFYKEKPGQKKGPTEPEPKIQELRIEEIEDEETETPKKSNRNEKGKGKAESQYLSSEHVILLKIVDSRIFVHHKRQQELYREQQHQTTISNSSYQVEPAISLSTVENLTEIFAIVSSLTIEIFKTLDQSGIGKHSVEDLANLSSGLTLLLGCFAHLSLYEDVFVSKDSNDLEERTESVRNHREPLAIPTWFKAQHKEMVQGGVIESAI
ncbi:hypothetical protein BGZ46_001996, partial [Entomortierella lignicola]